ncbi:peptidoglycan/xylan/chitin deacetylase (PgdA/CDA1 family) [Pontibacter aydingkolensis]|uniref:Polysaccharide deacetylase family protein n=1 Tax=Pontibacter aydingkolensis TaxID=1911536 RepID=A0ABS7CXL6_9BACT|nr:polysaccharide deacetylase family protein [Pontibacter aydingkolensis]MBW7468621.1 polysaccharide deacetylase family protein [Pontibacter aydingkolensis]
MKSLVSVTGKNILLPFYHTVSDKRLAHICNLYTLRNTKLFINDLEFYCRHYKPITLSELYLVISGQEALTEPVFHLTFDDGLKEFYTVIAPILEQKGIPATVFLNSDFIDNTALFYRYKVSLLIDAANLTDDNAILKQITAVLGTDLQSKEIIKQRLLQLSYHDQQNIATISQLLDIDFDTYLKKEQPYLSATEISDLIKRGFTMGSHSIDHPLFKSITLEEQKRQIKQSFKQLEQRFGITDKYFSFPFSDDGVSLEFLKWLHSEANLKLTFGISGLKADFSDCHLHRIPVEGTSKPVEQLIKSEYLYYLLKAPLLKNSIRRK